VQKGVTKKGVGTLFHAFPPHYTNKCKGVPIFGDAKICDQIWSCFSQITYKQKVLTLRLKPTIVNKSRCLHVLLPGNRQRSVTNQFMCCIALLQLFVHKLNSRRQRIAAQIRWCRYLHLVDEPQTTDFSALSLKLLLFINPFITKSYK